MRADEYWLSTYIIAHEIGHLLSSHLITENISDSISIKQELEADNFAGNILSRLGCPKDKSLLIFKGNFLQNPSGSKTHPKSNDRINAIIKGWENNLFNLASTADPPLPNNIEEIDTTNKNFYFSTKDLFGSIPNNEFTEQGEGIILSVTPKESEGNFEDFYSDWINPNLDKEEKRSIDIFKQRIKYLHSSCKIKVKKWHKNKYLTKKTSIIEVYFTSENAMFPSLPHEFAYNNNKFNIYKKYFVVGQPISFKINTNIAEGYADAIDFYEFGFLQEIK